MAKLTQRDKIIAYINEFGSITSLDAYRDLGITQLAARIFELKKQGYGISSRGESTKNRYGETCYITRYSLQSGDTANV